MSSLSGLSWKAPRLLQNGFLSILVSSLRQGQPKARPELEARDVGLRAKGLNWPGPPASRCSKSVFIGPHCPQGSDKLGESPPD